jgi:hypothetical protein
MVILAVIRELAFFSTERTASYLGALMIHLITGYGVSTLSIRVSWTKAYLAIRIPPLPSVLKRLESLFKLDNLGDQWFKINQSPLYERDGQGVVSHSISEGTEDTELFRDNGEEGDFDSHVASHTHLDVGSAILLAGCY